MASPAASPAKDIGDPQHSEPTLEQTTTVATSSQNEEQGNASEPALSSQPEASNAPVAPAALTQQQPQKQPVPEDEDDDESDFDELDEVLDDFKPKPSTNTAPSTDNPAFAPAASAPEDLDELAFMNQLEKDMANMMSQAAQQSGATDPQGFEAAINQGADAFTKQLEESGIPPGDFLKQLLADVMAEEGGGSTATTTTPGGAAAGASAAAATEGAAPESFNDAIQRTINRMKESGDKATAAASEGDSTDDLVAQLLKALEAGADGEGGGDDSDLTKMFMGMMEQLSNKEMLYEPMKELDTKFGPWIKNNKGSGKVSAEDMARYEKQAALVSQIVGKFEEASYSDDDPKCREFVWERMQEMQAAGNPPDELVANPWMDDFKGGVPDCPQQ